MIIRLLLVLCMLFVAEISLANCSLSSAKVADRFMQAYYVYLNNQEYQLNTLKKTQAEPSLGQWIEKNTLVSQEFKQAYQQLETEAKKQEPELGLDYDPIFNAQDYPDQGYKIIACDKSGLVTFTGKSKEWQSTKLYAKVRKVNKNWLVDGIGAINMSTQ